MRCYAPVRPFLNVPQFVPLDSALQTSVVASAATDDVTDDVSRREGVAVP